MRDVLALSVAAGFVGLSFGAIAIASGLPGWAVIAMSAIVFAGGSQFMAVSMLVAGNPVAAVLGGLLLNARHFPFGMAVADVLGARWRNRLVGSHILIDESVAFALAQPDARLRRQAYWMTGFALFVCWNIGTVAGLLLGNAVGDPAAIGLDAAFPAGLLALILPGLREPAARRVAVIGALVAVLATPLLPAGLPVLLSLVGLVAAGVGRPGQAGQEGPSGGVDRAEATA
ncbi:AzlC family ABC transporter permease [Luedemannella helvata]|uniref:AzlC family ABC transporter permease n=2 Tax=Luedemannella helvata TaxID=349315 RepID=A0ABN2JZD3_9ACTN